MASRRKYSYPERRDQVTFIAKITSSEYIRYIASDASSYFWNIYKTIGPNQVGMVAVVAIVLLMSFLLPNISQKIQVSKDLKSMKKVLVEMSKEVNRAEAACYTVAEEVCNIHYTVRDRTTETFLDQNDLSVCTSNSLRNTQSAPVQVDKKIGFFRKIFFPNRFAPNKEIALMSYVYTHSFDAPKPVNVSTEG